MARSRPCRVCRRWFVPSPRAGDRQRVCSTPSCQRERHRRACASWHQRHPDYDREGRLRAKLRPAASEPNRSAQRDPVAEVAWSVARDAVGVEASVIIEETAEVLVLYVRDVVAVQATEIKGLLGKVARAGPRDAIAP